MTQNVEGMRCIMFKLMGRQTSINNLRGGLEQTIYTRQLSENIFLLTGHQKDEGSGGGLRLCWERTDRTETDGANGRDTLRLGEKNNVLQFPAKGHSENPPVGLMRRASIKNALNPSEFI